MKSADFPIFLSGRGISLSLNRKNTKSTFPLMGRSWVKKRSAPPYLWDSNKSWKQVENLHCCILQSGTGIFKHVTFEIRSQMETVSTILPMLHSKRQVLHPSAPHQLVLPPTYLLADQTPSLGMPKKKKKKPTQRPNPEHQTRQKNLNRTALKQNRR